QRQVAQHLDTGRIQVIDAVRDDDDVLQIRSAALERQHGFLEEGDVGEVKRGTVRVSIPGRILPYMYAANETMIPVRMPFWMFGANASVATNVAIAAMPSSRLARQLRRKASRSTSPTTASMITAASTGFGRW